MADSILAIGGVNFSQIKCLSLIKTRFPNQEFTNRDKLVDALSKQKFTCEDILSVTENGKLPDNFDITNFSTELPKVLNADGVKNTFLASQTLQEEGIIPKPQSTPANEKTVDETEGKTETEEQKAAREAKEAADKLAAEKAAAEKTPAHKSWIWTAGSIVLGALAILGGIFGSEKKGLSVLTAIGGILIVLPWLGPIAAWLKGNGEKKPEENQNPQSAPATEGAGG